MNLLLDFERHKNLDGRSTVITGVIKVYPLLSHVLVRPPWSIKSDVITEICIQKFL